MKTVEKIGLITVESNDIKVKKQNGAEYLRNLVEWLNNRPERLNEGKSHLTLIAEYNNR